ncbi:MAG: hypothetical protein LiPW41_31 [Parcubacteria group bacterium LiPW_41]|nr:MAG: hypothetical protein LiPW41_31 [Parcubacteria group bacterium LiPW_41]
MNPKRLFGFLLLASIFIFVGIFLYSANNSDAQAKPNKPRITSLVPISACRIDVNFSEDSVASSFDKRVSSNSFTQISGLSCSSPTCTLTHSITGLEKKKSYTVSLRANSSFGSSDWSDQVSTTTLDIKAPSVPANIKQTWESGTAKIVWDASSGMTPLFSGYRVYEAKDGTKIPKAINLLSSPVYWGAPSSTLPYYFNIKAYEIGDSCPLGTVTLTDDGGAAFSNASETLIIPPTPQNVSPTLTPIGSTGEWKLKLSWDTSSEATSYIAELSLFSNFSSVFASSTGSDTNYNVSQQFSGGQKIYYRVFAKTDNNGVIGTSKYAEGSVVTGIPAPEELTITKNLFNRVTGTPSPVPLTFTWVDTANNFPRYVVIEKSTDGGSTYTELGRHTVLEVGDVPELTASVPIGSTYLFRAYVEDKISKKKSDLYSNVVSANLVPIVKKFTLDGEGWMQTGGWLKVNSAYITEEKVNSSCIEGTDCKYKLGGGAWNPLFGWLSFEVVDSAKCPTGGCAVYDEATGQISGWARFLFENPNAPGWDGWVNLRGATQDGSFKYGLCFGNSETKAIPYTNPETGLTTTYQTGETCKKNGSAINNKLKGIIWGGPTVGGWIVFEDSTPPSLSIKKSPDAISYAPRERVTLWVVPGQNVSWSTTLGTVSPDSNIATTTFTAPDMTDVGTAIVFASSTTEKASTTLSITKNPYQFYCTPDKGSINVEWIKEWSDPNYGTYANHMLILEYSTTTSPGGPWKSIKNPSIGSGVYTHNSLSTSTSYYYRLSAGYPTPSKVYYMYTSGCKPDAPVAENPSRLRVYAQNLTTLLLNWKDNATSSTNYTFQVERIKLTPATTTQFGVTTTQAKVTSQTIPLTWKNITTSTPFDIWLERSSSTVNRFRNEDKASEIYPGCSTDAAKGDPACVANRTFHNTRPVVVTSTNPKKFTGVTSSVYLSDNVGREGEGTTFFYRIRACSSIVPKYTECLGSECSVNDQYRPKPACSLFNASSTDGKLVATTTPPLPVIKATSTRPVKTLASNHWNYDYSPYKTTLTWTDDSVRETGTIIQRNGLTAVKRGNAISFENIDLATTTLNPDVVKFGGSSTRGGTLSWEDNTLEAGEIYTYKIVPYYETTDPITGKFVRVISIDEAPSVEVRTAYRVIIGVDGDGAGFGYVTENLKNLNTRTGKVIADYEPEEQAQIEWNYMPPDTTSEKNAFFNTWNGVSGCTTQNPCNTPRLGKIYANAEFLKWCYNFTADVGGDGCGSVSIKSYTACQSPHTGGAYQRDTQIVVDHSDDTNACYFTNWSGSCSGTSDTCTVTINQNSLSAIANFGKYCFDYDVSVSPSVCATPTVSGGTACPVQYSGGAYQKGSSLTAGYKDKLSTCNFSTWVGSPNVGYLQSDMSAQARFTTTTASSSSSSAHLGGIKLSQFGDQKSVVESLRVKISKLLVGDGTSKKSSPVSSFTASVYDAIASFASEIKNMIGGIFSAGAAYNANEDYFVIANVNPVTQPSFKDDKLEPDTVYYYRVGLKNPSDPTKIKWSMADGSGKTLPNTAVNTTEKSPVCVRNSYCDFSLTKWVGPDILGLTKKESSEKQCKENSDCINVGRKRQTTEEQ